MAIIENRYYLAKETAQAVMNKVIADVYDHAVTKFHVALTAAVDELPMLHVEFDAHANQYSAEEYLKKGAEDVRSESES